MGAPKILSTKYFQGGIAESEKIGLQGAFAFGQSLNIYQDPTKMTLMPAPTKISSTTVVDLIKWFVPGAPFNTNIYSYDTSGNIYSTTASGTTTLLRTVSSSKGQGFELHGSTGSDYLYYVQNTQVGRYGPLSGSPAFTDNWQTGLTDTSAIGFAPAKAFKEGIAIGHGNKMAWWDGSVWTLAKLTLPPGMNIRCFEVIDEYLAIGTYRSVSGAITDSDEGYIFLWDGSSITFNFFVSVPDGAVNSMLNSRNRLLINAGTSGIIYLKSTTYLNMTPFQKAHQLPKLPLGNYVEVYPGAMTNWKGLSYIGFGANTDSSAIYQGLYAWGQKSDRYPECLNYCFPISTGTVNSTSLKIGAVQGVGNNCYIGWRDGANYGIDKLVNNGTPYTSGTWESLIFDDEQPGQQSKAITLKATHLALNSGETVQLGYKNNRAANYTTGSANGTVGSTETRFPVPLSDGRFNEFQFECILGTNTTTSPTITSIGLEYQDLKEETQY